MMQDLSHNKELSDEEYISDIERSDTEEAVQPTISSRRRRINNIKFVIILSVAALLVTSIILNFMLMYKVFDLEERINHLLSYDNYFVIEKRI